MPQKKNPDEAELTRGKTGRLYGNLMSILTILKALRSSYNRDMQEDKKALFDPVDTVRAALELFSAMLPEMKINRERMEAAANDPNLFACGEKGDWRAFSGKCRSADRALAKRAL